MAAFQVPVYLALRDSVGALNHSHAHACCVKSQKILAGCPLLDLYVYPAGSPGTGVSQILS